MAPRKAPITRTTPATTTNTTSVTNAQLQAMIDQGVTAALAARDANRSTNGEDSHNSGTVSEGLNTNGIKKLEAELWNLKVKGTDVIGYNQRFQELALLCVRMVPEESDKVQSWQAAPQWAMYCKVAELQEDWPHDSGLHYIVIAAGAKEPDPMETMQQGSTKRFTYPIEELICRQALAFSWLRLHFEDKASFCQGTLYSNHGSRSQTVKAKPCPNGQSLMEL
ncbi:hypothetical protein Tco_1548415 [Tanacetum coccineum]